MRKLVVLLLLVLPGPAAQAQQTALFNGHENWLHTKYYQGCTYRIMLMQNGAFYVAISPDDSFTGRQPSYLLKGHWLRMNDCLYLLHQELWWQNNKGQFLQKDLAQRNNNRGWTNDNRPQMPLLVSARQPGAVRLYKMKLAYRRQETLEKLFDEARRQLFIPKPTAHYFKIDYRKNVIRVRPPSYCW